MAYAFGTVTDNNDFLTKLMQFASGTDASGWSGWTTGGAVPSSETWTVLSNTIPAGGSNLTVSGTAYLEGPGSESGDNIVVGLRTYSNNSNFIFGVELRGYTAYDNTLNFDTMPGVSPSVFVAMAGVSMQAWFWVNGRRIMACLRIGGIYDVLFHLGFFLPYGTHNQYPYPLLISGSVANASYNYTEADLGNSSLPDPNWGNACYFRWIDGTWKAINHFNTSGYQMVTEYGLYPLRDTVPSDGNDYNGAVVYSEDSLIQNWQVTGTQFSPLEINAYVLFPVVLNSSVQLPGQIDGLYYVPGNGLAPGDTIEIGGTTYDVFHNTWRSTQNAFYTIPRI